MRKISVLVALILCVTVGGVYAAWTYAGSSVSTADRVLTHGVTTATSSGDLGVMKVEYSDIDIKIDQTAVGDYTAVLEIAGSITVSFTLNDGAPEENQENAIPATCSLYLTNADTALYENKPIYAVSGDSIDLVWEKQDDGSFRATVSAEQIATLLTLGDTFVLDTHDKWTEFHALEEKIGITALFSQKTTN